MIHGAPHVGDPEAAVAFLADLNGAYHRSLPDPGAPAAPKPNVAVVIDPSPEADS